MGTRHWPYDATEAYEKLEQQLAEKNAELDSIKGGEFNRRVQKVADLWKGKCERLEKQNVLLRNALTKLYRVVTQAKPDVTVMCDVHAALDATQDLSGGVICDAEPAAWISQEYFTAFSKQGFQVATHKIAPSLVPLYKARNP